jgi:3-hydroxyisobutyrate dehydrogenase-like beta-hydroxyacid dehydrogenase
MENVGVIGLGNMGTGMAKNLLKNGFKLVVYDIHDEAFAEMVELGAGIATSPHHVGEQSDVVLIMVGNDLFRDTAKHIIDRRFEGAGACIQTMYKDLGITLSMAMDSGVPMFTTSTAYQLFQAGISLRPQEDNWTIIKILEEIAGTEVKGAVPLEK